MANPEGRLVEITCPRLSAFVPNTNRAIYETADELRDMSVRVHAKTMSKESFSLMQKAVGITYNPRGLLWDRRLRRVCPPVDTNTSDWVHIYLCKGVGCDELSNLLRRMKEVGVKSDVLREEIARWQWPLHFKRHGKNAHNIFSEKRVKSCEEAGAWKSSAGEFLLVAPIVLDWVHTHLRERSCLPKSSRFEDVARLLIT